MLLMSDVALRGYCEDCLLNGYCISKGAERRTTAPAVALRSRPRGTLHLVGIAAYTTGLAFGGLGATSEKTFFGRSERPTSTSRLLLPMLEYRSHALPPGDR